jgi:hypothetical protein
MSRGTLIFQVTAFLSLSMPNAGAQSAPGNGVTISGGTAKLLADGARALPEAIYSVSKAFNTPAGFEEVKVRDPRDMLDVTSPKYVPKSKDDRAFDTRGGPLDVTFPSPALAASPDDIRAALQAVLNEYHRRGYPGRYSFEVTPGAHPWIYVYPVSATDESGKAVAVKAITRNPIALTVREGQQPDEILEAILDTAGRISGEKLLYVGMGQLHIPGGITRIDVTSGPVFAVLDSFSNACGRHFWQLLYVPSPSWKNYFFSFRY